MSRNASEIQSYRSSRYLEISLNRLIMSIRLICCKLDIKIPLKAKQEEIRYKLNLNYLFIDHTIKLHVYIFHEESESFSKLIASPGPKNLSEVQRSVFDSV